MLESHPNANILNERLSALVKSWTQIKGAAGTASMVPRGNA